MIVAADSRRPRALKGRDLARLQAASLLAVVTDLFLRGEIDREDVAEVRRFVVWLARASRRWRRARR